MQHVGRLGHLATLCSVLALFATPLRAESLYHEASFRPLVGDKRAHRPGDSLTVLVYENSSASTTANAALKRGTDWSAQAGASPLGNRGVQGALGLDHDFQGGGTVQRAEKLLAQITVTVVSVAENGDLWVRGEQLLEVNHDRQQISVEGRLRTLDISDANTVQSNRLADAKIRYTGSGDLADRQQPGWISKVLLWLGL